MRVSTVLAFQSFCLQRMPGENLASRMLRNQQSLGDYRSLVVASRRTACDEAVENASAPLATCEDGAISLFMEVASGLSHTGCKTQRGQPFSAP